MAVNPYSVPFAPLDFSGLGEIADVYQRAGQNRDFNDLRRKELALRERTLSAEEYRKTEEFRIAQEERARARELEKIKAFEPAKRMAMQSPELATSLYKSPFGFSFMKSQDLGAGEEGPQMSPQAPFDRPAASPPTEMASLGEQVTAVGQHSGSPVTDARSAAVEAPAAIPPATPRMRLYADVGAGPIGDDGQRRAQFSEVSAPQSPTGYGPKYDAVYEAALASGATTFQAWEKAQADYKMDTGATALAQRQIEDDKRAAALRVDERKFQSERDEKFRQDAETRTKLDWARIAAINNANANKQGPSAEALAALAAYANKNPSDTEGLYKMAGALGVVNPQAAVAGIDKTATATGEEKDRALRAAQGLRAAEGMEKSGYVPNREDTQKWLNNQRWVYMAKKDGVTGLFALGGQVANVLPQSEVEGLSPQAAEYFANVRRLMEPLARAKSGAAISETEWVNFFNQYGPNSPGGLRAAKSELEEMRRLSGPAGRQLESGPTGSASRAVPKGVPPDAELVPGKVGPNGRAVYRKTVNGKVQNFEVD